MTPARFLSIRGSFPANVEARLSRKIVLRPPPLPQQVETLERVLSRVATMSDDGGLPVVVFDLDGALFDSRLRTLAILSEYATTVRGEYPNVAECLDTLEPANIELLLSVTLRRAGLTHVDVIRDITHFWHERFHSDEYLGVDLPLDGSPEYVRACHESGATVLYLGGRDLPGMMLGTVSALRDHGFPIAVPGSELALKPDATLSDEAYKRSLLPELHRVGDVVAYFDRDSEVCNRALREFDECDVVLIEGPSVPGAPDPHPEVHRVGDFRVG